MQDRPQGNRRKSQDEPREDVPALDFREIWRRHRVAILLVGALTLVTATLFFVVVVTLAVRVSAYLGG